MMGGLFECDDFYSYSEIRFWRGLYHKTFFKHKEKKNKTELSTYIWQLKNENKLFKIEWKIIKKVKSYQKGSKNCNLCLAEKLLILKSNKLVTINKRDLLLKCLHKHKWKLKNLL